MPPKRGARNAKPAQKAASKTAKNTSDDFDSADSIDLNDATSYQISAAHPELVDELDEKLLPYLRDNVPNFLRYKVLKRKRDLDNDNQSSSKRQKKNQVEYDDQWQAQSHLGSGTFRNVGLWVKKNSEGEIVDEIAIKEAQYQDDYVWSNVSGLSREAVMHNHVNKTGVQNFVQLRSFKCFIGGPRTHQGTLSENSTKWLYYLDYAPHGDLLRLIDRYRAWDQYLPEVFLWHVFDSLAKAIFAMADQKTVMKKLPPQAGNDVQTFKSDARLIHFDIKPENIFCGPVADPDDDSDDRGGLKKSSYPTLKLADFGVTEFDNGRDEYNPYRYGPVGTRWYMPPEQKLYGIQWQRPPNHGSGIEFAQMDSGDFKNNEDVLAEICEKEQDFRFTQAMNVWNVGKTMYDLTSLSRKWDYARLSTKYQNEYEANNGNAIANFNVLPFQSSNLVNAKTASRRKAAPPPNPRQPYSAQLTDLIRDCMRPEVTSRITAQALYARTQAGLAKYENGKPDDLPKVFFERNDINNMAVGNEEFPIYDGGKEDGCEEDGDVKTLLYAKVDPDWEALVLPSKKWKGPIARYEKQKGNEEQEKEKERQEEERDNPKPTQPTFRVIDGKIRFGADKARGKMVKAGTANADDSAPAVKSAPSRKQAGPAGPAAVIQYSDADDSDTTSVRKSARNKVKVGPPGRAADSKGVGTKDAAPNAKGQSKPDAKQDKKGKAAVVPKPAKSAAKQADAHDTSSDDDAPPAPKKTAARSRKDQPVSAKPAAQSAKNPTKVAKPAATKPSKPVAKDARKSTANLKPAPKKQAPKKVAAAQTQDDDDDEEDEHEPYRDNSSSDDNEKARGKARAGKSTSKVAPKSKADKSKTGKQKKGRK